MQISKISSPRSLTTFGHSPKSQNYIEKKLAQDDDKAFADSFKRCVDECNKMEEAIKKGEKSKKHDKEHIDALENLFLSLKQVVLDTIMTEYDDSNDYLISEYDYYKKSLNRCKDKQLNWRSSLIDSIATWDYDGVTPKGREKLIRRKAQAEAEKRIKQQQEAKAAGSAFSETFGLSSMVLDKIQSFDKEQMDIFAKQFLEKAPKDVTLGVMSDEKGAPKGFSEVVGMEELKKRLKEEIIDPVKDPNQAKQDFLDYGKEIQNGVLLYGPPGCGKTYIIQALANEINAPVYTLDISKAGSKFINQTSNNIQASFDFVKKCANLIQRPVILFMDEIDSFTMKRSMKSSASDENLKQVDTLLKCITDAQKNNVIVIGASNMHDLIDPAILRRFKMLEYVGVPNADQRAQMIRKNLSTKLKGQTLLHNDDEIMKISDALEGYSYDAVNSISNRASLYALRRNRAEISTEDFKKAIENANEQKIDESLYKPAKIPKLGFANVGV